MKRRTFLKTAILGTAIMTVPLHASAPRYKCREHITGVYVHPAPLGWSEPDENGNRVAVFKVPYVPARANKPIAESQRIIEHFLNADNR